MITLLTPHPAALVKTQKTRTLVVADLHIGWEAALSQRGIHVPTQAPKLLRKLKDLLLIHKPERLLILGDVKHTVATAEMSEWQDIPDFFNRLKEQIRRICVVRGNHDGNLEPLLPEDVTILPATGTALGEVGLFHGHRWPSPALLKCKTLIMGHVHPVVAFRDPSGFRITRQVWVRVNCNRVKLAEALLRKHKVKIEGSVEHALKERYGVRLRTSQLFVMPSFNDFLGGRPLNRTRSGAKARTDRLAGPVLRSDCVDMENAEIYLLDGTFLGSLNQLRSLS